MKKTFIVLFIGLVLGGLVFIQKYLNDNSLFKYYPYAGELLHLTAGVCVSVLVGIFLNYKWPNCLPKKRALSIILSVLFVETAWELLEVYLGWNKRLAMHEYIFNTIEDITVTFVGGLIGLLFFVSNKKQK